MENLLLNDQTSGSDYTLLACRWKEGDRKAGEQIFDHFAPQIYRFYIVRIFNREIAEDLTQNVFLKVTHKINSFHEEMGSFSSWIWQIARNTLIDYFREKKQIVFSDLPAEGENFVNERDDPTQEIRKQEILSLLTHLSPEEQEIFALHHISDLSYREISLRTQRSEGALRVLVHRINQKLRTLLNERE
jgi:RNA polymerase sigma-70 factor, ECF subfamily